MHNVCVNIINRCSGFHTVCGFVFIERALLLGVYRGRSGAMSSRTVWTSLTRMRVIVPVMRVRQISLCVSRGSVFHPLSNVTGCRTVVTGPTSTMTAVRLVLFSVSS